MPILKSKIFNSTIDLNYQSKDKEKLLELIKNLNARLKKYDHLNGKISDNKILILAALSIEDDLLEKKLSEDSKTNKNDIEKLSTEIIILKDKIHSLESEINQKNDYDLEIKNEIQEINKQIEELNKSMLTFYDE